MKYNHKNIFLVIMLVIIKYENLFKFTHTLSAVNKE